MISEIPWILLADDDKDDSLFFKEALDELQLDARLTTVHDGEQLMLLLAETAGDLPDVLFLDLNMPRKNGFECLREIKQNPLLKALPVIIISTSFEQEIVDRLHAFGARHYICKPSEYSQIKKVIYQSLILLSQEKIPESAKDNFVLTGDVKLKKS